MQNLPPKTLTRAKIALHLCHQTGMSKSRCLDLVNSIFSIILCELEKHHSVKISSFGVFRVRLKNERLGRNPKTLKPVIIKKRVVMVFKSSDYMRAAMDISDKIRAG